MTRKGKIIKHIFVVLLTVLVSGSLNSLVVIANTTEDNSAINKSSDQKIEQKNNQSLSIPKVLPSDSSASIPDVPQTAETESNATTTIKKDESSKKDITVNLVDSVKGTITYLDDHGKTLIPAKDVSSQVGGTFNFTTPENIDNYTIDINQSKAISYYDKYEEIVTIKYALSYWNMTTLEEFINRLNQIPLLQGMKSVEVRYVYIKNPIQIGQVTAKYVDTEGQSIASDNVLSGKVGDSYRTEQLAIDGFSFKSIDGQAIGQYTTEAQMVTYVYTKNSNQPVTPIPDNQLPDKKTSDNQTPQASNDKQLPSTGDNQASSFAALIMGLITLVVSMSFVGLRFKHKRASK